MDVIKGLEQEGVKVHKSVKETGRILGVGSFGTVVELNIKGFGGCAGKKIHDIFVPEGGFKFLIKECKLMSGLIHPDITKFLGVCLLPSSKFPALVMELMDYSFEDVIENKPATFEKLALTTMISIFIDVASGLAYLHSRTPRVLHRDLTARNVLLDKYMNAKITDFGNSRIIETTIAMKTMTQIPGTQVYMPPEALDVQSRYNDRLDIFSFGHLALYTLIREFPKDILPATYLAPDGKLVARNEVERRSKYMVKLNAALPEENHNLYHLTRQCLHNDPSKRPSSTDLGHWLQEILNFQQGDFQETIEDPYLSEEAVRVQLSLREMEKHLNEYPSDDIQYYEELPEGIKTGLLEKKSKSKTKGWRAYSFTIDYKKGTFQYNKPSMLGGKSNAIKLADITEIKEMKPNGIRFSFEVHFEGKNSPWELNVYSEDERQQWKEALTKPPGQKPKSQIIAVCDSDTEEYMYMTIPTYREDYGQTTCVREERGLRDSQSISPDQKSASSSYSTHHELEFTSPSQVKPKATTQLETCTPHDRSEEKPYQNISRFESRSVKNTSNTPQSHLTIPRSPSDPADLAHSRVTPIRPRTANLKATYAPVKTDPLPPLPKDDSTFSRSPIQFRASNSERAPVSVPEDAIYDVIRTPLSRVPVQKSWPPTQQATSTVEARSPSLQHDNCFHGEKSHLLGAEEKTRSDNLMPSPRTRRNVSPPSENENKYHATAYSPAPPRAPKMPTQPIPVGMRTPSSRKPRSVSESDLPQEDLGSPVKNGPIPSPRMARPPFQTKPEIPVPNMKSASASAASTSQDSVDESPLQLTVPLGDESTNESSEEDIYVLPEGYQIQYQEQNIAPTVTVTTPPDMPSDTNKAVDTEIAKGKGNSHSTKSSQTAEHFVKITCSSLEDLLKRSLSINPSTLTAVTRIGKGQYGEVYKAQMNSNIVAVKRYLTEETMDKFENEITIMSQVCHHNVIRLYGIIREGDFSPGLVMEFLSNGDLKTYLQKEKQSHEFLMRCMKDVAMGMHYLCERGLVHRDLAARNVLLDEDKICKVSDFGLLREVPRDKGIYISSQSNSPSPIRWMAPESITDNIFSPATDVWSFGIVQWEMFFPDKQPYYDMDIMQIASKVCSGYQMPIPRGCPTLVAQIMRGCWERDPNNRPNFLLISTLLTNRDQLATA